MARIQTPQRHGKRWRVRAPHTRDWVAFDTREAAETQLDRWRMDARRGQFRARQDTVAGQTLDQFRSVWLLDREHQVTAAYAYRQSTEWNNWVRPYLGARRLRTLSVDDMLDWVRDIRAAGASPHAQMNARVTLSAVLRAAANRGLMPAGNPLAARGADGKLLVPYPVLPATRARSATWDEVQLLMKANRAHALLWRTIAEVGLRASEAAGLTTDSLRGLDTDSPYIAVYQVAEPDGTLRANTKSMDSHGRDVPISTDLAAALAKHTAGRRGRQRVFLSPRGKRWTYRNLADLFSRVREAAGLADDDNRITLHDLRHHACTTWFDAGIPPQAIQRWMGHARLETTMRYAHTTDMAASLARAIVRG